MRLEDSLTAMVADLVSNISNPPLLNPPLSYCLHHEVESRLKDSLTAVLADLATKFKAITSDSQLSTFRDSASEALHGESVLLTNPRFTDFKTNLAEQHDTIRFWYQFISEDCFACIGLFITLRYRNWDLRTGSLKLLGPVYSAFDHSIYQE